MISILEIFGCVALWLAIGVVVSRLTYIYDCKQHMGASLMDPPFYGMMVIVWPIPAFFLGCHLIGKGITGG